MKALFIIDMLNDFYSGTLKVPNVETILNNIKLEINKAKKEGYLVFFICDSHDKDCHEFAKYPEHCIKDTWGSKIIDELETDNCIIIEKDTFDTFYKTDVDALISKYDIKEVILTGVCTEICVLSAVVGFSCRNIKVTIPEGTTKGLTEETENAAKIVMNAFFIDNKLNTKSIYSDFIDKILEGINESDKCTYNNYGNPYKDSSHSDFAFEAGRINREEEITDYITDLQKELNNE